MEEVLNIKDWLAVSGEKQFRFATINHVMCVERLVDETYFKGGDKIFVFGISLLKSMLGQTLKFLATIESFDQDCVHVYLKPQIFDTYKFDLKVKINDIRLVQTILNKNK